MPMQQYQDFEARRAALQKELERVEKEAIVCPTCGCQYFEQVVCAKYKADHNLILGQDVPQVQGQVPYVFLKCIRCSDLMEPNIMYNARDVSNDDYGDLVKKLNAPLEKLQQEDDRPEWLKFFVK